LIYWFKIRNFIRYYDERKKNLAGAWWRKGKVNFNWSSDKFAKFYSAIR
jgi:hypothetical protein